MIYNIKNSDTLTPNGKSACILLNGNITIEKSEKNQTIPSNSYFFFDTPFYILATSPYLEAFVIELTDDFLKNFPDIDKVAKKTTAYFKFQSINNVENKKHLINAIEKAKENERLIESYMHILWSELFNDFALHNEKPTITERFSALIDQNVGKNYCAGDYAEMLQIPLKKLIKEVKKSEQKTPCNFITEKVIEKAKHKLLHTADTSQMIAYQLGFKDPYYFIKYFKKSVELTPTQYRNAFLKKV
ncbi:helix-turn-helix domain-containing protein [Tenacibaculum maritimum]|uniref:helix-turn-helix domain-containing protein n=1 Tax=Tenacibaculum maritimum TaxID=107401 RepID=UPI002307ABAA|nr:AraC family transcriptional regulator [Tenacibaculum maritimum]MDB0602517.1 AraC family transcriptional regulator [Tenacibaculum maritimum]MDB0613770.1 AraC family transcriptional regulator [Tenacibaculum maritimum]